MSDTGAPLAIRFVVAQNLPVSITRLTATTASALARRGIPTTVVFPLVDWLDYKLFRIRAGGLREKAAWVARLLRELAWKSAFPKPWCGFRYYGAEPRIRTIRYVLTPPCPERWAREVTLVQHPYVIPHLLRSLRDYRTVIVSMVHNNYEKEMRSPLPEQAAWKRYGVAVERMLGIPRIASSTRAKDAAERLGIRVDRVISGGLDLELFHPPPSRVGRRPLTVTLYCDTHPQKGQTVGLEAVKMLKARLGSSIRTCSLGNVLGEGSRALFDDHYGYLHRKAYADALRESEIVIYPSLFDGFPAPPLEAMACGCALVTTAVEGTVEYAVDGENCLVCPTNDAAALRDAVLRLIEEEPLRARLQQRGPVTAQAYRVDETARQLLMFCQELLNGDAEHAEPPVVQRAAA